MSRSKRLAGVANAAPIRFGHLDGGHSLPKYYLLQFLVRLLLVADVVANHRLIPTHRGNKIFPGPEMLTDEIASALPVHPRQMDCALAFHVPHDLRYLLRRYRQHRVHMSRIEFGFVGVRQPSGARDAPTQTLSVRCSRD